MRASGRERNPPPSDAGSGTTLVHERSSSPAGLPASGFAGDFAALYDATMATVPGKSHIEACPETCGGRPRIAGTRIRVQDIVVWTEEGKSPDEIVASFPQVTLADVHAALAYYHDNRDVLDRQLRDDEDRAAALKSDRGAGLLDRARSATG